ncbi:HupE/UreJ family protein [Mesorhizobium shangrilense]|uniref:HupE/UreJ family protein n=1 Tax=Mesorhizobium shangrilense TaxID=460060 RepID=UPI003F4915E3
MDTPMIISKTTKLAFVAIMLASACKPALSHIGVSSANSFAAGFAHPLFGLDHIMVMVAVGLWAALKGGRALWAWPAAFVGLVLAGGALGIAGVPVPFVEPVILASIVVLGLLVAAAADLPVATGAVIIGLFALFHGHAHGTEIPETAGGLEYLAGFALATALLHGVGIGLGLAGRRFRALVQLAGAATAAVGLGLIFGAV